MKDTKYIPTAANCTDAGAQYTRFLIAVSQHASAVITQPCSHGSVEVWECMHKEPTAVLSGMFAIADLEAVITAMKAVPREEKP
jgi:hypothetical protein